MLSSDEISPLTAAVAGGSAEAEVSRRSLLRGAAVAGVAGLTAYSLVGTVGPGPAADAARSPAAATAHDAGTGAAEQIVVHISDARSGRLDIFHGTNQSSLRDPDLVARLVRASMS